MNILIVFVLSVATIATAGSIPDWYSNRHRQVHHTHNVHQISTHDSQLRGAALPTIAGAAIATESLSTLVTAVQAAGLVDTLNGAGTFTVFAPNNAAFAKIPSDALADLLKPENVDKLKAILLRHVISGWRIKAAGIPVGTTKLQTYGGETITVTKSDAGVTIESSAGKANVIATDVLASNGVVHVVDTVF